MITSWDIYWITRLDAINIGLCLAWIVVGLIFIAAAIIYSVCKIDEDSHLKEWLRITKYTGAIAAFFLILNIFTPSTKEFAVIYLLPKIVNNEQVQKVPENLVKLLNVRMEQWIDEKLGMEKKDK